MGSAVSLPGSIDLLELPIISSMVKETYITHYASLFELGSVKGKTVSVHGHPGTARGILRTLLSWIDSVVISFR